jgi:glycine oxidase
MAAIAMDGRLDRSGALLTLADRATGEAMLTRLQSLGGQGALIAAREAQNLVPGLADQGGAYLFTAEDWRLDPGPVLAALDAALLKHGGRRLAAAVRTFEGGTVYFTDALAVGADVLILATGPAEADGMPLTPIKGQILRFAGLGPSSGPVVRGPGVYVAPGCEGLVVGATMEPGLSDRTIDPDAVERLRRSAAAFFPILADAPFIAVAGVRAATADGLPLVGPGRRPGVLVARGARRNGWLLAPLIAEVVIEHLRGGPPSAQSKAFDPARRS